ncbi:TonB-dependent receptor plug domain-containing protein [Luteolibacter sp. Populi]|uniref:TonB-dependent receptor plug domain-containing protein n=1 Tax=Luteolibacter sp. Populi TaxID=3230487 RepID=UPI003467441A
MRALPLLWIAPLAAMADPSELGELVVEAMKPDISNRVTSEEAEDFERRDLAEALTLLPGVSLTRVGARAETMVTVRGFDLRQVPVFIDGIPAYVVYDGYPDLGRFTIPDAGEIEVAKGLSPVLAGPNTLGGLINVFTRRPTKELEGDVHAGAFSGGGWEAGLGAGGRQDKWYWQFDLSWIEQSAFELSDDFVPRPTEDGGRRNNSYRNDWRASGRLGWTPAPEDEYVLGFWIQRGEKGNPPYTGYDKTIRPRFWQWPQWDKDTYYMLTRTELGADTTLETNLHYDRFENLLRAFDNASYSSQTLGSSFNSYYDDWTAGGMVKVENRSLKATRIATAFHYKVDHHEEMNLGAPKYTFEDETASLGLEAEHSFPWGSSLVAGISYDWRRINDAVDTNTGAPLTGEEVDSWNPSLIWKHKFSETLEGHLGWAEKSRFPTIKDRYSYRMGQAIPNPDLKPETVDHFDLGLAGTAWDNRFQWETGVFYSRIDDAIQRFDNVAFTPGGAGLFQLQNVGEAEHRGFETAVGMKWTDCIETGLRYAWINAENRSNPRIHIIGTPEHEVFLFSKIQVHENVKLIPSFVWADSRDVSSTGKRVGTYASVDFKAEVSLPGECTLGFGATNLLDRNQQLDEGFPEPGRSLFVDLRHEF